MPPLAAVQNLMYSILSINMQVQITSTLVKQKLPEFSGSGPCLPLKQACFWQT